MKRFQLLISQLFPYIAVFAVIFAVMFFGSRTTDGVIHTPIAATYGSADFKITSDQVSETYTVANIASTVSLPSTSTISENFVTVNTLYETTGTTDTSSTQIIDKPSIIDTSSYTRGVIKHIVEKGETIDSILVKEGLKLKNVTVKQVRWSNGLKTAKIKTGATLYLPSISGIVYKVKKGDTINGIVKKYKARRDEMISLNDLEDGELKVGSLILLPGGTLPEKERPEYVAPKPATSSYYTPTYNYSYSGDSGDRHNMIEVGSYSYWSSVYYKTQWQGNPGAFGNCTWFAWYWRRNNMPKNYWLPKGAIGNAGSWVYVLGSSYYTGRVPKYGAVMQSMGGYYGHVGIVVGVNYGNSITIQEMNFAGPNGMFNHVYQSTMKWSDALKYNYIYEHR
ncbi:MAG: CHAP domain-containing protein [Candidatus Saccharibacteria bacterium]|nr:CHAP domain-containing protein [Candidatus Saccharibacteria bacterium]